MTPDQASELADVVTNGKYSPWTWSMLRLYGVLLVGFFCATINGYDGSVMGGLNAMESYLNYFNMKSASSSTGFVFAIYGIGSIAAVPFVGPLNDWLGRRSALFVGSLIVILGACVTGASKNHGMFLGGRFVLGFGVCFCNVTAPVYVSELAHPVWRGTLMGMYNSFWHIGSILAAWVIYGAKDAGPGGWRIPLYCQLIASGIVVCFIWFLPESPRWLVANGKISAARKVLTRYHGEGDPDHPLVQFQMREMENQISVSSTDKRWWDYSALWKTRSARRRLICVVSMGFFGQWSGNSVTSYYLPVMLQNAGITSESRKLLLNGIYPPLCFVASLVGARLMDMAGRRPLLLYSLVFMIVAFGILTPTSKLAAENPSNSTAANSTIAFIYLFGIAYAVGWTPITPVYIVEVLETNARAKGKSFALLLISASSTVIQYASGPAFEHLKYYFYIVFIGWDVFEMVIIYFFWPETKGRTLEELNEVFEARNPVKKSLEKKSLHTVMHTMHVDKSDQAESRAQG
ncbi:putative MFS monosaccharide transporter [Aspergillus steynii IBT 23096]|uniref:Putative MFS monosaccharide transporter n=1 Tax=Aspergillus steynii IBT 23096 TaxID=1392250 RepID=A0A2I2GS91_9EURO|nr:putative MFS monosaccharide transporter [Aspergillus steynii IBT 23096]PLB55754.1 putative MFS monosaccharide transporter [Aspergillus steynii IBT 23096]